MCVSNPENRKDMILLKVLLQHVFQERLWKKFLKTLSARLKARIYPKCTEKPGMCCKQAATQ